MSIAICNQGPLSLRWDPERRLLLFWSRYDTVLRGMWAQKIVDFMQEVTGDEPYRMVCDARHMQGMDVEYRQIVVAYFRSHAHQVTVGMFGAARVMRVVVNMGIIASGVNGQAHETVEECCAWLGIAVDDLPWEPAASA